MDLLAIYLEDHLALSLAGLRLARRCLAENRGTPLGRVLERLVPELEEDRTTLARIERAIGGRRSVLKDAAAALGEWAGRLKPNGRLLRYSELSRVWELEGLLAGTESRRALWGELRRLSRARPQLEAFDLERLEARARTQAAELARERGRAAREAFGAARASSRRRAEARA